MEKMKKLCVCGEYFIPKNSRDMVCGECKELSKAADGEIYRIERLREAYNRSHNKNITYGKFVNLIAIINMKKRRRK